MKYLLAILIPYAAYNPGEVALYNARFTLLQTEFAALPVQCEPFTTDSVLGKPADGKWRCVGKTDEHYVRLFCDADEPGWTCEMRVADRSRAIPRWERRRVAAL